MSNFLESKKVRTIIVILGGLIVLCVVFGLGIAVGYNRAGFAMGFDHNYYRNFYGGVPGTTMGTMAAPGAVPIHGIAGTVIDLGTSTISVKDQTDNEQSVALSSGTVIKEQNADIVIGGIQIGDQVAVIGEPNDQGQIMARFIRVFPASSSAPMPPSTE